METWTAQRGFVLGAAKALEPALPSGPRDSQTNPMTELIRSEDRDSLPMWRWLRPVPPILGWALFAAAVLGAAASLYEQRSAADVEPVRVIERTGTAADPLASEFVWAREDQTFETMFRRSE